MNQRNKAIPAVYLFLQKDDRYLLMLRFNTGYEDGNYHVPSGHVEDQELPTEAVIREAKEEIGIELSESDLEFMHVLYRPRHDITDNRIDIFFKAKSWKGEPVNCEPDKCDDLQWASMDYLPKNMTLYVRQALKDVSQNIPYREASLQSLKDQGYYKL